jgi:hypothetical protein
MGAGTYAERIDATKMIARFYFIGAMMLVLVLGACTSRVELAPASLAQADAGTSPDAGSTPGTAATGSAIPESVSRGTLPSIAPQTLPSTTGVTQNQHKLDRPQVQPSRIQSDPGSPEPSDTSTTGVTQNQHTLDKPQDQPSSSQSGPGSPEPSDTPGGDTSFGQLSYPNAIERQLPKTNE